jgi:hypothetical protein
MDSVTLGGILLAIVGGAGGGLGGQLWAGVSDLVRRPFHASHRLGNTTAPPPSGEAELIALEHGLGDEAQAVALAVALISRAEEDAGLLRDLDGWWARANQALARTGGVTNTISGGNQQGPVLQGRDFSGLTFGCTAANNPPYTTPQS